MDGFDDGNSQGKNDNQSEKRTSQAEKCNRPENIQTELDEKPGPGDGHFFGPELRQRDAH